MPVHIMKAYGGVEVHSGYWMEVCGHLCTLATLFSGKVLALATEQETGWAPALLSALGCFGEEQNLLINLHFLSFLAVFQSLSMASCLWLCVSNCGQYLWIKK